VREADENVVEGSLQRAMSSWLRMTACAAESPVLDLSSWVKFSCAKRTKT